MSTAVAEKPSTANGAAKPQSQPKPSLSPLALDYVLNEPLGIKCQIMGATGPKWSGKSILGHTIAPGFHPEGHKFAGKPRTLNCDVEMSSGSYKVPGVERVDVPSELREKYGLQSYKPVDMFVWFRDKMNAIEPGQYDCIMVDPATDIETGMMEYVRSHPTEFGYSAAQFSKMDSIAIAACKDLEKRLLLDFAARCKVFYFTAHEKAEWKGNKPTGKMVAKGMGGETGPLFEVASLYLRLERDKTREGDKPKPPSATLLKERLNFQELDPETGEVEIIPILPERLPEATVKAIRHYVKHPVGRRKKGLNPDELAQDQKLTDDEKRLIELEISANNATAATANLSLQEKMLAAAQAQVAARGGTVNVSTAPPAVQTAPSCDLADRVDMATLDRLKAAAVEAFGSADGSSPEFAEFAASKLQEFGGLTSLRAMSMAQAEQFEAELLAIVSHRQGGDAGGGSASTEVATTPAGDDVPFDTAEQSVEQPPTAGPMTDVQVMTIKSLLPIIGALAGDKMQSLVKPILNEFGVNKIPELNSATAATFLDKLQHLVTTLEMEQQLAGTSETANPPAGQGAAATTDPLDEPGSITNETLSSLKDWATKTGWTKFEDHQAWLKPFGIVNFRGLSQRQAEARIAELQQVSDGFGGGTPKN